MFIIVSFCITKITAQTSKPIFNSFGLHYSLNGTGDMKGLEINVSKRKKINKTFDWYYGSSLTTHFNNSSSNRGIVDYTPLKFQTFGIQGETGLTIKLFENKFPFQISTSPIVRFQSTTYPSVYSISNDQFFPRPRYDIVKSIPNTLSVGYKVQLELGLFKIRRSRMFFNSYFQNDTRSDVITGLGIVFKNLSY